MSKRLTFDLNTIAKVAEKVPLAQLEACIALLQSIKVQRMTCNAMPNSYLIAHYDSATGLETPVSTGTHATIIGVDGGKDPNPVP